MPDINTELKGQGTDLPENNVEGSDNPDSSEGEKPAVPYTRFHEVNSENKTLKERVSEYETKISEYEQLKNASTTEEQPEVDEWTQKATKAENWGVLINEIKRSTIEDYEKAQETRTAQAEAENKKAEQQLLDELQELTDDGAIKTEDDKNSLIKFAIDQSNKYGVSIPLKLANQLMNGQPKSDERKSVSSKVQSSKRSSGSESQNIPNYKKSLDEIIFEAKQNAPSN